IKKYCWSALSATMETAKVQVQSQSLDNLPNTSKFRQDLSCRSLPDLVAGADKDYSSERPGETLLRAKTLTLNFQLIPNIADNTDDVFSVAETTQLDAGFEYNPTTQSELQINSVTAEPVGSARPSRGYDTGGQQP